MQSTLNQKEIEAAIREYMKPQLKNHQGMKMEIRLSATRGATGFKATIDMVPNAGSQNQAKDDVVHSSREK